MLPVNLVFNKSAIARVLNVTPGLVKEIREFDRVIWVWVAGKRPTFVSKTKLEQHFHTFRRESGRALQVLAANRSRFGVEYQVQGKNDVYHVESGREALACTCEDWHQHGTICKHGWAVLNRFGCESLQQLWAAEVAAAAIVAGRSQGTRVRGVSID